MSLAVSSCGTYARTPVSAGHLAGQARRPVPHQGRMVPNKGAETKGAEAESLARRTCARTRSRPVRGACRVPAAYRRSAPWPSAAPSQGPRRAPHGGLPSLRYSASSAPPHPRTAATPGPASSRRGDVVTRPGYVTAPACSQGCQQHAARQRRGLRRPRPCQCHRQAGQVGHGGPNSHAVGRHRRRPRAAPACPGCRPGPASPFRSGRGSGSTPPREAVARTRWAGGGLPVHAADQP